MRLFLISLSLASYVGLATASVAADATIQIVVSPWGGQDQQGTEQDQIRSFLLKQAPAGTHVQLWDGWSLIMLGETTIPVLAYDGAAARVQNREMAHLLGALKKWSETPQGTEPELVGSEAIKAPEVLQELSADGSDADRSVVLVGSPLYVNLSEPTFSMTDGRYPSDGHLKRTLMESVYGVAEKQGRLSHVLVHWVTPGTVPWKNELDAEAVTRFWALFVQAQGGTLVALNADLSRTLTRALGHQFHSIFSVQPNPDDEKAVMHSAAPREVPAWVEQLPAEPAIVAPPVVIPLPIQTAPVVPAAMSAPPTKAILPAVRTPPAPPPVGVAVAPAPTSHTVSIQSVPVIPWPFGLDKSTVGIGIAWAMPGVDLDLYVCPFPGATELYYARSRSKEGFLYSDERNANAGRNYEFVQLKLGDLSRATIWVNFYAGHSSNITGQVVLFSHGQVKVGTFTIAATAGNHGRSSATRARSADWTEIKLSSLVDAVAPLVAHRPTAQ